MNRHRKYLLLTAGVLLATSCVDDPVSLNEQPTEDAEDLPVAYQQQGDIVIVDDFRPRLDIEFEVVGELSPGRRSPSTSRASRSRMSAGPK